MSEHRDSTVAVDQVSRAHPEYETPRHRAEPTHAKVQQGFREEIAFFIWCQQNRLDPEETASMVAYEDNIGWLYLDEPPEDHRV
jgi:hypothetical protein